MRSMFFAGIFALSASTALAQTGSAPAPAAPATSAPQAATPATQAAGQQTGKPANICQELVAFMKAPPPEAAAPAAPAKPAAAPAQATPSQDKPAAQQGSSALAGTTPSNGAASAKPETGSNSAQAVTGQDGVATDAPKEGKDNAAAGSGSVANAPQKESRAAPVPPADVTSTPKESVMTVAAAEELAGGNDIAACQEMARKLRVAGVSMPPPLMALAALDLKYQQEAGAATPPAGTGNGQAPASNAQD